MDFITWTTSPWGRTVPAHVAWGLMWMAIIAGVFFIVAHSLYVALVAPKKKFGHTPSPAEAIGIPERVPRHSLAARFFHWIMALSVFALLLTAFLPKVGVEFNWVFYHWIAGLVLTAAVLFHIFHAIFVMDFWSIWPDRIDVRDATRRVLRFFGKPAPSAERFAKYPLENKLYHCAILLAGLAVVVTGLFMMKRVPTIFAPRNPYLFSDMTWGLVYVFHGLAGVGLIALVIIHVYMGLRPEKFPITKSMLLGWMSRDFYIEEHDPKRWVINPASPQKQNFAASDAD